jgi:very-short-patch-repair endonuclease
MTAAGILVLHFSPYQLRTEPDRVLREIAAVLQAGRPAAGITTRSAA